jgi:hypothetical protein
MHMPENENTIQGFETIEVFLNAGGQITIKQARPALLKSDDHYEIVSIPREYIPMLVEMLKRAAE